MTKLKKGQHICMELEGERKLTESSQEIIELLNTAKYLLRGREQNLNISWALERINKAIKLIKDNDYGLVGNGKKK